MLKYDIFNAINHIKTNKMVSNIYNFMKKNKITFKKMSFDMKIPESTLKNAIVMTHSALSTLDKICDFYKITLPNFDTFNYGAYCGREQAINDLIEYLTFTIYQLSKAKMTSEEFNNYYILIVYEYLFNNRIYIPSSIRRKSKFIDLDKKLIEANNNIKTVIERILNERGLKLNSKTYQSVAHAPLEKYKCSYDIPNTCFEIKKSNINTDNNIGNNLQSIRTNNNLTLDKFGNIFSLDGSTIKNIESGREKLKYDYVKWIYALFDNVDINRIITSEQATLNFNYEIAYNKVAEIIPNFSGFRTRYANKSIFIPEYRSLESFLAIISTGFKINNEFRFESYNYPNVKLKPSDIKELNEEIKKAVKTEYKDALTRKYTKICFKEFYHYDEDNNQITLTDAKLINKLVSTN